MYNVHIAQLVDPKLLNMLLSHSPTITPVVFHRWQLRIKKLHHFLIWRKLFLLYAEPVFCLHFVCMLLWKFCIRVKIFGSESYYFFNMPLFYFFSFSTSDLCDFYTQRCSYDYICTLQVITGIHRSLDPLAIIVRVTQVHPGSLKVCYYLMDYSQMNKYFHMLWMLKLPASWSRVLCISKS